jgi:hypothetical protein
MQRKPAVWQSRLGGSGFSPFPRANISPEGPLTASFSAFERTQKHYGTVIA